MPDDHLIRTAEQLFDLYGEPLERSVRKQLDHLDNHCRAFIAAAPFLILSTQAHGLGDASPRGDAPGFAKVQDDRTLLIPDRRGNNRVDNLRNILDNPAVGLLFLVPGVNETLRVNGTAVISSEPSLTSRFEVQGKLPKTVLVVTVLEAYIHCSRALVRADLWNPAKHAPQGAVPSFGTMLQTHTRGFVEAAAVDDDMKVRLPATLY